MPQIGGIMIKWIPWKYVARRAAQAYGFADPTETLRRLRGFSRPSEAAEPLELLRAGFIFHSRGIINTKAIQNNLDWVWPYWVARQFDPTDVSFVPRAFSFSHINLTHRNWTAVGTPGSDRYGIVDPRGLVTPYHDSWSIDAWIVEEDGSNLFPSKLKDVRQSWPLDPLPRVETHCEYEGKRLSSVVSITSDVEGPAIEIALAARCERPAWLAVAIRPYNPEGIQFIDTLEIDVADAAFIVNGLDRVRLVGAPIESYHVSNYEKGDVSNLRDFDGDSARSIECPAGMATAVAMARMAPGEELRLRALAPRRKSAGEPDLELPPRHGAEGEIAAWRQALEGQPEFAKAPCAYTRLYRQACATLALLSPRDIYPGPYTYRRFWFRDACLMVNAVLATGQVERCRRIMEQFPARQTGAGYFLSQEGEWDSNGQVLWAYDRFEESSGERITDDLYRTVWPAALWIEGKRVSSPGTPHDGLLPAGFSAEHLGPNDHYYWDDFWAIAGLEAAARLFARREEREKEEKAKALAADMRHCVEASLRGFVSLECGPAWPASPYRRMDSGTIGSLVADYPLRLYPAGDKRIANSLEFLLRRCLVRGAFFQDMIHSGMNVYLTLDMAQSLMRVGDARYQDLVRSCVALASSTGQWPEAIHPVTLGGCMGDGQHGWAAAEWIMFIRNAFVREEGGGLVIGSGFMPEWFADGARIRYGPTPTPYGDYSVVATLLEDGRMRIHVSRSRPRGGNPPIAAAVSGFHAGTIDEDSGETLLEPRDIRQFDTRAHGRDGGGESFL